MQGDQLPLAALAIAAAFLGVIVGSFLGAALERLPHGRSILTGRSHCDSCDKALTVPELLPVLSWMLQRGKCRGCGGAIGGWQLACELGAGGIAVLAVLLAPPGAMLAAMVLGWFLLLLALLDLRHLWLPRAVTGLMAVTGLILAAVRAAMLRDAMALVPALAGGALGFALLWLVAALYQRVRGREGMGGGDPPLLGAIGVWLGPAGVIHTILGASVLGLLAALALAAAGRRMAADTALPLGTCLAVAAWPLFLWHGFG